MKKQVTTYIITTLFLVFIALVLRLILKADDRHLVHQKDLASLADLRYRLCLETSANLARGSNYNSYDVTGCDGALKESK